MSWLVRKILLFVCTLAFLSGSVAAFAVFPERAEAPRAHEHQQGTEHHRHDKPDCSGCLACCVTSCVATPGLPSHALLGRNPATMAGVSYWPVGRTLVGRYTPPASAPPRPIV
jgi:hypothetical protein